MVEIPRRASLSEELLKFFFLSSTFLFLSLTLVFHFLGGIEVLQSALISIPVSVGWTFVLIQWLKGKIERVLGRLMYVVDLMEQSRHERAVAAVPIYEEMMIIIESIKEVLSSVESKCDRELKELEEQLELISENTAQIIERLQLISEGDLTVTFPSGLDLSGAIGQAVNQSLAEIRKRILSVRASLERLYRQTQQVLEDCESINDKTLRNEIYNILKEEEKILKELGYFKC